MFAYTIIFFGITEGIMRQLPDKVNPEIADEIIKFHQLLSDNYLHYILSGLSCVTFLLKRKFFVNESNYAIWLIFDEILNFYWSWSWKIIVYLILEHSLKKISAIVGSSVNEKTDKLFKIIRHYWRQIVVFLLIYHGDSILTFTGYFYLFYISLFFLSLNISQKSSISRYIQTILHYSWYIGLIRLIWLFFEILWSLESLFTFLVLSITFIGIGRLFVTTSLYKILKYYAVSAGLILITFYYEDIIFLFRPIGYILSGIVGIILLVFIILSLILPNMEQSKSLLFTIGVISLHFISQLLNSFANQIILFILHFISFLWVLIDQHFWTKPNYSSSNSSNSSSSTFSNSSSFSFRSSDTSRIITAETSEKEIQRILKCDVDNYYEILGIDSNVDSTVIKAAYMRKARLVHPDKTDHSSAQEAFNYVSTSYETLIDEAKRQDYDNLILTKEIYSEKVDENEHTEEKLRQLFELSIACAACGSRHPRNETNRNANEARWCSSCMVYHPARNGDGWGEQAFFSMSSSHYYICLDDRVWDITEYCRCIGLKGPYNTHNPLFSFSSRSRASGSETGGSKSGGPKPKRRRK
eukprot:c16768_g1_i3.p1 GENE.c16768_g1_i3~~c16768_g1_i3.p1  ORF type:complete len:583 (+),score=168.23 c16768_g1_i3:286-2034(+)